MQKHSVTVEIFKVTSTALNPKAGPQQIVSNVSGFEKKKVH